MTNLYFLTPVSADSTLGWSERISEAGMVTLMGMCAVFLVLILLWGCIEVMHRLIGVRAESNPEQQTASGAETVAAAVAEDENQADAVPAEEENDRLVAVITAAVAAAMTEEGCTKGFRVVSFQRTSAGQRKNRF